MGELTVETRGAVELWTINGEARMNALSRALVAELEQNIGRVTTTRSCRAVVLTGAGARAFCAGADLKERTSMTEDDVRTFLEGLRRTFRAMERSDAVFIAAINGLALGGGTELALSCDLRLASKHAELGLTEVRLGIIPGGGGTQRLPRLVGLGRAKDLILTGRRVDADEALALGLIGQVTESNDLIRAAVELGQTIANNAPIAVAAAKHAIDEGHTLELDSALQLEHQAYEKVLQTEDRLEGLRAFKEKRPPRYLGR